MKTWEVIKKIEETSDRDCERAKATLLSNYGPDGETIPNIISEHNTLEQMVVLVCQHYENKN